MTIQEKLDEIKARAQRASVERPSSWYLSSPSMTEDQYILWKKYIIESKDRYIEDLRKISFGLAIEIKEVSEEGK